MQPTLEVLFTPAEFESLRHRDLSSTRCVVFDVLRATSSMVTALANGAEAIIPVSEIAEAIALHHQLPDLLLAGERQGVRIQAELTGGTPFDLGNSPREFTPAIVAGKTIVMTTTNGTRALRACAHAQQTLVGSLLNLTATARFLLHRSNHGADAPGAARGPNLIVVCSGTHEQAAWEDTLAAGALCDLLWEHYLPQNIADSARIARQLFLQTPQLTAGVSAGRNGQRLLSMPELREDVAICGQRDSCDLIAALNAAKRVVRFVEGSGA